MAQWLWYELRKQTFLYQKGMHVWLTVSPGHTNTGISVIQENERILRDALNRGEMLYCRVPDYANQWVFIQIEEPKIEVGKHPWDPGVIRTVYHAFMAMDKNRSPDCTAANLESRLSRAGFKPRPKKD